MKKIIGGALLGFALFCIISLIQFKYGADTKGFLALGIILICLGLGSALFLDD